jgi:hypothetical protein
MDFSTSARQQNGKASVCQAYGSFLLFVIPPFSTPRSGLGSSYQLYYLASDSLDGEVPARFQLY